MTPLIVVPGGVSGSMYLFGYPLFLNVRFVLIFPNFDKGVFAIGIYPRSIIRVAESFKSVVGLFITVQIGVFTVGSS